MDFRTTAQGDEVTVHIVKQRLVEGDYQRGYTIRYAGITDVKMLVKDGQILSYEEMSLPDNINEITYNKEEKKIIELALGDHRTAALGADDAVYIGTRIDNGSRIFTSECPDGECVFVMIEVVSGDGWIRAMVDSTDMYVVKVDWIPRKG